MVYLFLADGFEETEALVTVDILRRGGVDIRTAGILGLSCEGAHGITVMADMKIEDISLSGCEMLILPGGRGYKTIMQSNTAKELVTEAVRSGMPVAAICAAPVILSEYGLLKGARATCYPGVKDDLKDAQYVDEPVVCDGGFITGKAAGCVFEFALSLLARLKGDAVSKNIESEIYFER